MESFSLFPFRAKTFFLAFIFLLLASPPLKAMLSTGPHAFVLSMGQVWSRGDLGKDTGSSIGGGLSYEYATSDVFSMQLGFFRNEHQNRLAILSSTARIKANLVYYDQLVPYVFFGTGFYFASTPPKGENKVNSTHFGINLGGGADLELGARFFLGAFIEIHNLFSDRAETPSGQERRISGRLSSFLVRMGMRF